MKKTLFVAALAAVIAAAAGIVSMAQQAQQREQPSATEDAVAAGGTFPLAAKAGQDSNAKTVAPPGATNQGAFDMATWKYGTAWNAPSLGASSLASGFPASARLPSPPSATSLSGEHICDSEQSDPQRSRPARRTRDNPTRGWIVSGARSSFSFRDVRSSPVSNHSVAVGSMTVPL